MFFGNPVGSPPINTFLLGFDLESTFRISVLLLGSKFNKVEAYLFINIKAFLASAVDKFALGLNILFAGIPTKSEIPCSSNVFKLLKVKPSTSKFLNLSIVFFINKSLALVSVPNNFKGFVACF